VYRKIIFLIAILLFSTTVFSITINLERNTYTPEDTFQGSLILKPGTYLSTQQLNLSTFKDSRTLLLQNLIDCSTADCTQTVPKYTTTPATETELSSQTILTGLKIQKGSKIADLSFDISNKDSNYPDQPTIDVGNDKSPEWTYQGFSTDSFDPVILPEIGTFDETIITENCQLFDVPKASKYNVNAYLKKTSSSETLDMFIAEITQSQIVQCDQPTSTTTWENVECRIVLDSPLEEGQYHFCLVGSENILATNSTSEEKNGFIGCSSSCTRVNKDYVMDFSAGEFTTTLDHKVNFNTSNLKKDEFGFFMPLADLINNYLATCPYENNFCVIPINISSKNPNEIKISNLNYKETTTLGEILLKRDFLSSVAQKGTSSQIILNSIRPVKLSSFKLKTPEDIASYNLDVTFGSESYTIPYNVVDGPKARINVSKNKADIFEPIKFNSFDSYSPNNLTLTFLWDFDDKTNSSVKNPTHSYSQAGTYVVSLTVTDENDISSTKLKTITIGTSDQVIKTDLSEAIALVDKAEEYSSSSTSKIKRVYSALNFNKRIEDAKVSLVRLDSGATQIEIDDILNRVPKSVNIKSSLEISPFPTTDDINILLPLQDQSFRETAKTMNEVIEQKISIELISVTYASGNNENFALIRKEIKSPQDIESTTSLDLIPATLLPSANSIEFIKPTTGETTKIGESQSVKISLPKIESSRINEVVYKLSVSNIRDASQIKTLILPSDLDVGLVAINCGDNICNPGEDIISCPEDCSCGNDICEIDETVKSCPLDCESSSYIYVMIASILVFLGAGTILVYKTPSLKEKFEVLISKLNSKKKLFSSPEELEKIIKFIKASKAQEHTEKQISLSLLKKGWSKAQVKRALKKSSEKKS
jgi:PKD repeat protein